MKPSELFGGFFIEGTMNPLNFIRDPFGFGKRKLSNYPKNFDERPNLQDLTVLVTGGSKGIGAALVDKLISRGMTVICVSRSVPQESPKLIHMPLDLSEPKDLEKFVKECPIFDAVVFNAGGMPQNEPAICKAMNIDQLYLLHVLGPAWITQQLIKLQKLQNESRVIVVTSGGALPTPLNTEYMGELTEPYDKIKQYAFHKRYQIHLVEYLEKTYINKSFNFYSMHPGWVDTPGLKQGMPSFYKFTRDMLREPKDGADTIDWLICSEKQESGRMYFDRRIIDTYPIFWVPRNQKSIMLFMHKLEQQLEEFNQILG